MARRFGYGLSVAGPFVRRVSLASPCFRFHIPLGWADFPLPTLGERFTRLPTGDGEAGVVMASIVALSYVAVAIVVCAHDGPTNPDSLEQRETSLINTFSSTTRSFGPP